MRSASLNKIAITAIISPTTKKLTKKQTPPIIRETKVAKSSHSFFLLAIFMLKTENNLKKRFLEQKIYTTCQIFNQKLFFLLDFDLKISQQVRLLIEMFTTRQILNQICLQRVRFWIETVFEKSGFENFVLPQKSRFSSI